MRLRDTLPTIISAILLVLVGTKAVALTPGEATTQIGEVPKTTQSPSLEDTPKAIEPRFTWIFKDGSRCADCAFNRTRWVYTYAPVKFNLHLVKPEGQVYKKNLGQLVARQTDPSHYRFNLKIETEAGEVFKNMAEKELSYQDSYYIFTNQDGDIVTLPLREIKYITDVDNGRLVYDGPGHKEQARIATQQQLQSQQNGAVLLGILGGMMLSPGTSETTSAPSTPFQFTPLPVPARTNLNCRTNQLGNTSYTDCSGW